MSHVILPKESTDTRKNKPGNKRSGIYWKPVLERETFKNLGTTKKHHGLLALLCVLPGRCDNP